MSVAEVVAEPAADSAQAVAIAAVAEVEREIADAERKVANLRRAIAEEDHPELAALLREDMAAALAARGAAAAGAPAVERSWRAGKPITLDQMTTIAAGTGVRAPVPEAVADMRGIVDDGLLVDDGAMLDAVRAARRHLGIVLEPSGVAGLAGTMVYRDRFAGQTAGVVHRGAT